MPALTAPTRGLLALGASALAGLAAVTASLDAQPDLVPFFVGLTLLGGIVAWAVAAPASPARRRIAVGAAVLWTVAAVWVGILLLMVVTVWQGSSSPPPGPVQTYLGLPATVYHLLGLYGGWALVAVAVTVRGDAIGR
jgi:hypothetical protein